MFRQADVQERALELRKDVLCRGSFPASPTIVVIMLCRQLCCISVLPEFFL